MLLALPMTPPLQLAHSYPAAHQLLCFWAGPAQWQKEASVPAHGEICNSNTMTQQKRTEMSVLGCSLLLHQCDNSECGRHAP